MDEYKVLTDIVNDSSITTAIISALLFLIYQFINKLFEYLKKKNDKNTTNTIKDILLNMKDISLSVSKLTDTVNIHLSSNIKKDNDKCRNTIILSFDSLEKIKETPHQSKLNNKTKRLNNLKNCFSANPEKVKNRNIILIDDVITTGATMSKVKKELKKAGARKVIGIAIAH